jgi:hypothetical protein
MGYGYGLWAMGYGPITADRPSVPCGGAEKNGASERLVKDVFCHTPIDALLLIGPIAKSQ